MGISRPIEAQRRNAAYLASLPPSARQRKNARVARYAVLRLPRARAQSSAVSRTRTMPQATIDGAESALSHGRARAARRSHGDSRLGHRTGHEAILQREPAAEVDQPEKRRLGVDAVDEHALDRVTVHLAVAVDVEERDAVDVQRPRDAAARVPPAIPLHADTLVRPVVRESRRDGGAVEPGLDEQAARGAQHRVEALERAEPAQRDARRVARLERVRVDVPLRLVLEELRDLPAQHVDCAPEVQLKLIRPSPPVAAAAAARVARLERVR